MTRVSSRPQVESNREPQTGLIAILMGTVQTVLQSVFGWMRRAKSDQRLELLETLQLGGKRQLMLVRCDGQSFLVGTGSDSVHTVVEVHSRSLVAEGFGLAAPDSSLVSQSSYSVPHEQSQMERAN